MVDEPMVSAPAESADHGVVQGVEGVRVQGRG
jgi:hypothetical protein